MTAGPNRPLTARGSHPLSRGYRVMPRSRTAIPSTIRANARVSETPIHLALPVAVALICYLWLLHWQGCRYEPVHSPMTEPTDVTAVNAMPDTFQMPMLVTFLSNRNLDVPAMNGVLQLWSDIGQGSVFLPCIPCRLWLPTAIREHRPTNTKRSQLTQSSSNRESGRVALLNRGKSLKSGASSGINRP